MVVDRNEQLLERARRQWPHVTIIANALQAGVSGNRNTGILHTRTPVIALLDDDACARPGWLAAMTAPLSDPTVIGTGSRIIPQWEAARPAWFPDELLWAVVGTSKSDSECTTVRNVWSASMAMRRDVFDAAGGFRLGFGKTGDRSRPEDTDLCLRMSRVSSGRWVFVPDAVVDHMVPAERATFRSVVNRCYHEGRGKVELARVTGDRAAFLVERNYMRKVVPRSVATGFSDALHGHGAVHALRAMVLMIGAFGAVFGAGLELIHHRRSYPQVPAADAITDDIPALHSHPAGHGVVAEPIRRSVGSKTHPAGRRA